MNDFYIASDRHAVFNEDGLEIKVYQLKVHNLDQWMQFAESVKLALDGKDHSDEILLELMKTHLVRVVMLCHFTTLIAYDVLLNMASTHGSLFVKLLKQSLDVNQAFFSEPIKKKPKLSQKTAHKNTESASWFESFQTLVSAGHSHESIMQMTYGTFIGYLSVMGKQNIKQASLLRMAQHADAKTWDKFTMNP